MAIAIGTTLWMVWDARGRPDATTLAIIVGGIAVGGLVGAVVAQRIKMTAMPQLVAFFHSLVGLAAVLVAAAALYAPESYGIGVPGEIHTASIIELSLGSAIGALTFTGSVIAFLKLNGNMSGAPIILPARHLLNIAVRRRHRRAGRHDGADRRRAALDVPGADRPRAACSAITLIIPIGGADMPVVVSMLNSYSGWAAAALGFTLENNALIITGSLVGSSGAILSYIMCKAMNRSFISVILGGFGGETAAAARRRPGQAREDRLGRRRGLHHEERLQGHHRPRLRHGRRAGPARAQGDGREAEGRRRRRRSTPSTRWPAACPAT